LGLFGGDDYGEQEVQAKPTGYREADDMFYDDYGNLYPEYAELGKIYDQWREKYESEMKFIYGSLENYKRIKRNDSVLETEYVIDKSKYRDINKRAKILTELGLAVRKLIKGASKIELSPTVIFDVIDAGLQANDTVKLDQALHKVARELMEQQQTMSLSELNRDYHNGGFVGGSPIDPKHEEVAKLLKGELVLSRQNVTNLSDNLKNSSAVAEDSGKEAVLSGLQSMLADIDKTIAAINRQELADISAIEEKIKSITAAYNQQIAQKSEEIRLLQQQFEMEERAERFRELDEEMNKVQNDTRFSYITETGEEEFTYDKGRYAQLQKERAKLQRDYEKQDLLKAKEEEIDGLEEEKQRLIQLQLDEIESIRATNTKKIEDLQLFKEQLAELNALQLEEMQIHIAAINENLQQDLINRQAYLEQLRAIQSQIIAASTMSGPASPSSNSPGGNESSPAFDEWSEGMTPAQQELALSLLSDAGKAELGIHHNGITSGFVGGRALDSRHEEIARLLKGELVLNSFDLDNIPGVLNRVFTAPAIVPTPYQHSQPAQNTKNYNFGNVTIKANDIKEFIRSIEFLATSE